MRGKIVLLIGIVVLITNIVGCQKDSRMSVTSSQKIAQSETQSPMESSQNTVTSKENKSTDIKDSESEADTDKEKAIDMVVKKFNFTYNKDTEDYSQKEESYNVILIAQGYDEKGRYEIRISPSDYPLSVYTYCYVDLKNGTITAEP